MMRREYEQYIAQSHKWVVVNTHPRKEELALENLRRQDFRTYCPMLRKRIKQARRLQSVLRPLFPGYVFVEVDPNMRLWKPILSTLGVRTLVRFGHALSLLDDGFIESLRARELEGAIVRPPSPYRIGQQVRMSGGPFDSLLATIIDMDEKERLVVLMQLLSRTVKVKVEARAVAPA